MVNPQILCKDKLSLHLILLTRKSNQRRAVSIWSSALSLSLFPLLSFPSSSFPPSHLVSPLGPGETELQGGYCWCPFHFVHHNIGKRCNTKNTDSRGIFDQTVPFSVSSLVWLKGEIIFPFQMILFVSVKKQWPCYLVRAQPAATAQVTHSGWTVTHLTCLSWPNGCQSKSSEWTLGQV